MTRFLCYLLTCLLVVFQFSSCEPDCSEKDIRQGTATLIGYKVAKHSRLYIRIDETGTIHKITSLGGRREPTLSLGDKFPIQYYYRGNTVVPRFNKFNYVRYPKNRRTRTVMLDEYKDFY